LDFGAASEEEAEAEGERGWVYPLAAVTSLQTAQTLAFVEVGPVTKPLQRRYRAVTNTDPAQKQTLLRAELPPSFGTMARQDGRAGEADEVRQAFSRGGRAWGYLAVPPYQANVHKVFCVFEPYHQPYRAVPPYHSSQGKVYMRSQRQRRRPERNFKLQASSLRETLKFKNHESRHDGANNPWKLKPFFPGFAREGGGGSGARIRRNGT